LSEEDTELMLELLKRLNREADAEPNGQSR
jgi:hypothetical protein